jgi:hypothetical protein
MRQRIWKSRLCSTFTALLIVSGQLVPEAARASAAHAGDVGAPAPTTLPMSFEPNVGQTDGEVQFLTRGRGYTVFLTRDEAVLALDHGGERSDAAGAKREPVPGATRPSERAPSVLRMRCEGATGSARVVGLDELPGKSNYLIGDDPTKWLTDVPTYARVRYEGVYDGVDLDFYGNQQHVEYDFRVAPGADPSQVRVRFDGAERIDVDDESGDLVLRMEGGEVRQQRARVYQEDVSGKRDVSVRYSVMGDGEVAFDLGAYDPSQTLVIDPVIVFSSYLGGSNSDQGTGIAVDGSGAVYVVGETLSANFPTASPIQATHHGQDDAFVTKLNAAGTALVYSTYIGGSSTDTALAVAVDDGGLAYVTGFTASANFPLANPLRGTNAGANDVFVAKLNAAGTALIYSTYLGGSGVEVARGRPRHRDPRRRVLHHGFHRVIELPTGESDPGCALRHVRHVRDEDLRGGHLARLLNLPRWVELGLRRRHSGERRWRNLRHGLHLLDELPDGEPDPGE